MNFLDVRDYPMLRAYRLVYDYSSFGPPQLWEWEQPYIDHLILNTRTFGRRVVGWWFDDWTALDSDNTRIWQTYYESKPLSQLYTGWQEMLAEHRQIIVHVQEIAEETGWRGPEVPVKLDWQRRECGMMVRQYWSSGSVALHYSHAPLLAAGHPVIIS